MRAYNIQVNVGDLDHDLMGKSQEELAEWVIGFQAGMHGLTVAKLGNSFGLACFDRAKDFMDRSVAGGRMSAEARRAKTGSAQPPKGVRENTEGASKGVRLFPEVTRNQKPETYNDKQETNNQDTYGPALPTRNGVGYRLPRSMAGDLGKAYPGVDLDAELTKMSIWLTANPAKGKTAKGMLRFINGWLGRVRGTPAIPTAEDAGPSEADYLACVEIAKSCEADQRTKMEQA